MQYLSLNELWNHQPHQFDFLLHFLRIQSLCISTTNHFTENSRCLAILVTKTLQPIKSKVKFAKITATFRVDILLILVLINLTNWNLQLPHQVRKTRGSIALGISKSIMIFHAPYSLFFAFSNSDNKKQKSLEIS